MNGVRPIDVKVKIKPVFTQLIHHAAYEGPCRTGRMEDLTPEADRRRGQGRFARWVEDVGENLCPDAELLDPVYLEWGDDFVLREALLRKLEPDIYEADLVLVATSGLIQPMAVAIGRRYRVPVGVIGWVTSVDVAAHLRARGLEGYAFLDFDDLNHFVSLLRVRKAIAQTRILVALEREIESVGVASNIYDLDGVRQRYGVDYTCIPAGKIIAEMDRLSGESLDEAEQLTDTLIRNADKVEMTREDILPSASFYVAARKVMEKHECNAFVIPCFELCATRALEKRKVTFCLTHTLLKDEGFPSGCEGDINVTMAMALLMYLSKKSSHMGNHHLVDRERNISSVGHSVPALKMKGLDSEALPYEIRSFTAGGWGVTVRYDFARDIGSPVTLARFDPTATKLLVVGGEITGGGRFKDIGCGLAAEFKVRDVVDLFRKEADFGHHLAMVYGDYVKDIEELGELMGFEVVAA